MRLLRVVFAALVVLASSLFWPASAEALKAWSNSISAASIVFSADGSRFAVIGDKAIGVWNAKTGHPIHIFASFKDPITSAAISPDGRTLATATGVNNPRYDNIRLSNLQLWDVYSGKLKKTLATPIQTRCIFYALTFSRNGRSVVSGGGDAEVRFWSVATGQVQRTLVFGSYVKALACSPDGQAVAAANDGNLVKVWRISSGKTTFTAQRGFTAPFLNFSHNSRLLVVGTTVWDIKRSRRVGDLPEPADSKGVEAAATFNQTDQSFIYIVNRDRGYDLMNWNLHAPKATIAKRLDPYVTWMAFSPNGKMLIGPDSPDPNLKRVQFK